MVKFTKNVHRQAPYKTFKFRVQWDGKPAIGVSRVSGLKRTTEPVVHRSGEESTVSVTSPGETRYEPIVLERGRTHDPAFEQWANKVYNFGAGSGSEVSLKDYKKDIRIELYNAAGQVVMAFAVYNCWPSEYVALGELEADESETAVESLTLQHEGWERDYDVVEPEEPSFTEPEG